MESMQSRRMEASVPVSGYTLPVWLAAAARAAVGALVGEPFESQQTLRLLAPPDSAMVPVRAASSGARASFVTFATASIVSLDSDDLERKFTGLA